MDLEAFKKAFETTDPESLKLHQPFCRSVLNMRPGQRAVIANGKVRNYCIVYMAHGKYHFNITLFVSCGR